MQQTSAADRSSIADAQASLRRIATLVAEGATAEELFFAVAREVGIVLGTPVVTVDRYECEGSSPISVVLASIADEEFPVGRRWPLDGPSARAWIYETRRPVRIDDFSELDGTVAAAARGQGMSWVVGAPIIVDGELWGNICAGTTGDEPIPDDAESRLAEFTDLVSTAIANADSREELTRLAEEQAALRRVATLVARTPGSAEFFSTVAREVASVLKVPGVLVDRFETDGTIVTFGEAFDSDLAGAEQVFAVGTRMPPTPGSLAAQVFETHRAARVNDFSKLQGAIGDLARAAELGSGCGGPIVVNGEVWGLMCVFSRKGTVLPVETENRLGDFIELVATAIANYEVHTDLAASEVRARELAEEQAALRRVATLVADGASSIDVFEAVAKEVAEVLQFANASVSRYDDGGTTMTVLAICGAYPPSFAPGSRWPLDGSSAAREVLRTGRPVRIEDYTRLPGALAHQAREHGLTRVAGAPIIVNGRVWGLIATSGSPDERLPENLEGRLAKFTELLATAIANAESRADLAASEARARDLANEQAALRRVATLVARGASPDEVFSAVAEEVAGVMDIPIVGIRRYEADGTFTILGNVGAAAYKVGTRWPVNEGITGMVLATGRPVRKDGITRMLSSTDDGVWEDGWRSNVSVPIVVEGSIWGFMAAADKSRPLPADTEERLVRFTELVATAVSNATARTELLTSRARVVSAADETRRRLERDLHDGIQQWLVALALRARKAAGLSAAGEAAAQELSGLADDLVAVTDELRELSRGIHPAILSDAGLDEALKALARRSAIVVDLDVGFRGRYDPTLEATVYYVVAESITNAVKHAQASRVKIRGGRRDGSIELEINDDGVGGADPGRGTGLIGLKDRVDTLGGTISFASPAGAGTTIRVKLPSDPGDAEGPRRPRSDEAA